LEIFDYFFRAGFVRVNCVPAALVLVRAHKTRLQLVRAHKFGGNLSARFVCVFGRTFCGFFVFLQVHFLAYISHFPQLVTTK